MLVDELKAKLNKQKKEKQLYEKVKDIESVVNGFDSKLKEVNKVPDKFTIDNLSEIQIPDNKEVKIKNFPDFPKSIEIKGIEKIKATLKELIGKVAEIGKKEINFDKVFEKLQRKQNAVAVRLVTKDGVSFYNAGGGSSGGGIDTSGLASEETLLGTLEKQDTLSELVETLQILSQRLEVIAGMANAGAPALRTIPIASVSTAVTGSVTATVASTSITNFGTSYPAKEVSDDINNYTAIIANINNVIPA